MIEHIYKNVEFSDGALKRVIIEALDRAFRATRGRVPLVFKDEEVGYCNKYTYDNNFSLYTVINNKDLEDKKIGFNLKDVVCSKEDKIVRAEIYNVIVY